MIPVTNVVYVPGSCRGNKQGITMAIPNIMYDKDWDNFFSLFGCRANVNGYAVCTVSQPSFEK